MIDRNGARAQALKYVEAQEHLVGVDLELIEDITIERDFGWVFFYDASKHVETGDPAFAVGGNAPIIIDRRTGELHVTGTALPVEAYLKLYEDHGTCRAR